MATTRSDDAAEVTVQFRCFSFRCIIASMLPGVQVFALMVCWQLICVIQCHSGLWLLMIVFDGNRARLRRPRRRRRLTARSPMRMMASSLANALAFTDRSHDPFGRKRNETNGALMMALSCATYAFSKHFSARRASLQSRRARTGALDTFEHHFVDTSGGCQPNPVP